MAEARLKPKKEKTDKALLITAIVLIVIALVGLAFSMIMRQAVDDLLHPDTTQSENGEENKDAGEQAGRAIATVFAAIIFLPVWFLVEIITLALDIPSLVMSSTLCGRLMHDRKLAKQDEQNGSEWKMPEETGAKKNGKGMLIASVVLIVLNVAIIATLVIATVSVLA